jgi:hypothetical protein
MAAPEHSQAGRQGLELRGSWQCRSPPEQGGGVRICGARGSVGALLSREAESGAVGHVVVCLAPYLKLRHVCGGTRCAEYRQCDLFRINLSYFCWHSSLMLRAASQLNIKNRVTLSHSSLYLFIHPIIPLYISSSIQSNVALKTLKIIKVINYY